MDETSPRPPVRRSRRPQIIIGVLVLLLLAALGGAYYFYQKASAAAPTDSKTEIADLVKKVGRLMVLPDEVPTLATVSDPDKLKDQKFFINAHKGDKVLIFSTAQKAVLYDPTQDKIIEVAPVNLGTAPGQ